MMWFQIYVYILKSVLLQLLVYLILYFLLLLFSVSLLTPDKDYVLEALVFLIVLCASSYRWIHFSRAVLLCNVSMYHKRAHISFEHSGRVKNRITSKKRTESRLSLSHSWNEVICVVCVMLFQMCRFPCQLCRLNRSSSKWWSRTHPLEQIPDCVQFLEWLGSHDYENYSAFSTVILALSLPKNVCSGFNLFPKEFADGLS